MGNTGSIIEYPEIAKPHSGNMPDNGKKYFETVLTERVRQFVKTDLYPNYRCCRYKIDIGTDFITYDGMKLRSKDFVKHIMNKKKYIVTLNDKTYSVSYRKITTSIIRPTKKPKVNSDERSDERSDEYSEEDNYQRRRFVCVIEINDEK